MSQNQPVIYPASKITVQNRGGYAMRFFLRWLDNGATGESKGLDNYFNPDERTLDMNNYPHDFGPRLRPGVKVHPRCEIRLGRNVSGPEVVYHPSAGEVVYRATRSTQNAKCDIWKVKFANPTHRIRLKKILCLSNSSTVNTAGREVIRAICGALSGAGKLQEGTRGSRGTEIARNLAKVITKLDENPHMDSEPLPKTAWDQGSQAGDFFIDLADNTSPDEVYIEISGNRVWGGSTGTRMKPKDFFDLDLSFDFSDFCHLSIWEYDYVSNDDNLGVIKVEGRSESYDVVRHLAAEGETSLYQLTFSVEPIR